MCTGVTRGSHGGFGWRMAERTPLLGRGCRVLRPKGIQVQVDWGGGFIAQDIYSDFGFEKRFI